MGRRIIILQVIIDICIKLNYAWKVFQVEAEFNDSNKNVNCIIPCTFQWRAMEKRQNESACQWKRCVIWLIVFIVDIEMRWNRFKSCCATFSDRMCCTASMYVSVVACLQSVRNRCGYRLLANETWIFLFAFFSNYFFFSSSTFGWSLKKFHCTLQSFLKLYSVCFYSFFSIGPTVVFYIYVIVWVFSWRVCVCNNKWKAITNLSGCL